MDNELRQRAVAVVELAATSAEKYGICKGQFHEGEKSCLWGHIIDALVNMEGLWGDYALAVRSLLSEQLMLMFGGRGLQYPGATFNDLPDTTETDIAKVLLEVRDRIAVL